MINNFFEDSYKKVMRRFRFGTFSVLLSILLLIINGTEGNIWWLLTMLSGGPGSYFFVWSILKIPGMLRANAILKENFPPDFNKSDLMINADLNLPEIGTFIYKHHLFVLNKFWYYSIDLSDVRWIFIITLTSNVSSEECLVMNTFYKKRYYFTIPELTASGKYKRSSTDKSKDYVNYLFEYIHLNYPQVDLGYSWEKDKVYLKDQSPLRKVFEKACRHDASAQWTELNSEYNSINNQGNS